MSPIGETLGVFRNRSFRGLWLASLASNFGGLIQAVGAAWMMTSLTSSEGMVALVQTSITLPIMIGAFAAGALADNFDRRKVMLVAQVFMLVTSAALTFLAWEGWLTPWTLLAFTFLIGCGTALHNPSWQASIGDMVPRDDLPSAVSVNAMGMNMTRSVGPAIGGAIVAAAGAAAAFAVNAVSYVTIIVALLAWRPRFHERKLPRERFTGALADGMRYFAMSPHLIRQNARGFVFGFAGIAGQALLPVVTHDRLGGDALVFGVLLGCFGLGAVLSAFANVRLRAVLENEQICRIGFLGFALGALALGLSGSVVVCGLAMFVSGACWLSVLSLLNVSVQLSTPRWVLGRMLALYMTAIFGGMATGGVVWGAISDAHGAQAALLGSAGVLVFGAIVGIWAPVPPFSQSNLAPLNRFTDPEIKIDLTRRSGPIMILVEYDIDPKDATEFLELMYVRRRSRIRDGAQRWVLLRDLEHPEKWTETYHFPTWTEYRRHHERRTHADSEAFDRLLALHRGPVPLTVHRAIERQTISKRDLRAGD